MIKRCIIDIIEPMGFVNEGDNVEERWTAQFLCTLTGNILTVVAKEGEDGQGVPRVFFAVCDEQGNLCNTVTLDQLLVSFEQDLQMMPAKSKNVYLVTCDVTIQVPVDMGRVSQSEFNDYVRDGNTTETEIAVEYAREYLCECIHDNAWYLTDLSCENCTIANTRGE